MKKRVRRVANFLAFNLLFFALYLNFIHQDKQAVITVDRNDQPASAAFSGTILVDNPEKYQEQHTSVATPEVSAEKAAVVKRSIN